MIDSSVDYLSIQVVALIPGGGEPQSDAGVVTIPTTGESCYRRVKGQTHTLLTATALDKP
jgi:hypothetical protein